MYDVTWLLKSTDLMSHFVIHTIPRLAITKLRDQIIKSLQQRVHTHIYGGVAGDGVADEGGTCMRRRGTYERTLEAEKNTLEWFYFYMFISHQHTDT